MTEAEWLVCRDPIAMLDQPPHPVTGRKKWQFLAACLPMLFGRANCVGCRSRLHVFDFVAERPESPQALALLEEARRAKCPTRPAGCYLRQLYRYSAFYLDGNLTWCELWNSILDLVCWTNNDAAHAFIQARPTLSLDEKKEPRRAIRQAGDSEMSAAIRNIHDVLGNPFRPISHNSSWLAWNDGAISKMAQVIYDARVFDRLPLLADALEDAGCTDADILSHCRTPSEHVRGCWVVDLLLGKS
jgi:hypothetical protein